MSAAIKWGLITGAVYIIHSLVLTLMGIGPGQSDPGMMGLSFLINVILFGVTFFTVYTGVKDIRDNEMGGFIDFKSAFKSGMKIALIAALISAVFGLLNMYVINPGIMEEMNAAMEESYEKMEPDQAEAMSKWMGFMKNPILLAFFGILWVAFWGIIKSLIAASMLKKEAPPSFPPPAV
jgi:hypothetical protein